MLTTEQLAARQGRLTASRIACLMRGDKAAIHRLEPLFLGFGRKVQTLGAFGNGTIR